MFDVDDEGGEHWCVAIPLAILAILIALLTSTEGYF